MVRFIDDHRAGLGVEPICAVLPIAPSTYHRHRQQRTDPTRRSARAQRDDQLRVEIQRVYDEHQQVYGPRKVWKQLRRDGVCVARCTVARLMRAMGLAGAVRGRTWITTTHAGAGGRPVDLVDRQFVATRPNQLWVSDHVCRDLGRLRLFVATRPNQLWVSDFTYVATWGSSRASAGVFQPRVLRGRLFSAEATALSSARECLDRSVPFGQYWRSRPLVFSFAQKKIARPVSMRSWAWRHLSTLVRQ